MNIKTHKTHAILPNESLLAIIDSYLPPLGENTIVVITSKIISLCEGSVVDKSTGISKTTLIRESADAYLKREDHQSPHEVELTIKNNILIPSAGIDESNGNGFYILYPSNIQKSAKSLWDHLRKRDRVSHLGIIVSDSHSTPLRRGVVGIGLGWCGFSPLYSYIGKPDCFKTPLKMTKVNVLDSLTAAAVFCMGEGNEQTPLATITNAPKVEFLDRSPSKEETEEFCMTMENDLYAPLLKNDRWVFKSVLKKVQ